MKSLGPTSKTETQKISDQVIYLSPIPFTSLTLTNISPLHQALSSRMKFRATIKHVGTQNTSSMNFLLTNHKTSSRNFLELNL